MNLSLSSYFLLVFTLLLVTSCSQESTIFKKQETVFKIGDQQEWSTKNWKDQGWEKRITYVPDGQIFWSRTKIDIFKAPESLHPYGIHLHIYGEYEVFWDGVQIGKNGNPGQEANLDPEGKMWATFSIPTHLTEAGEHLLALRSSLYYFPSHTD